MHRFAGWMRSQPRRFQGSGRDHQGLQADFPGLGAINLEDISAPRCVEIERRLIEELNIPVFHDDQHGTAIVVLAALINGLRLTGRKPEDMKVIVNGVGAAGSSIIKMMYNYGFKNILAFDSKGVLHPDKKDSYNPLKQELFEYTNLHGESRRT